MANGEVHSILPAGNVTYIGGTFTYLGPLTGNGVPLNVANGSPLEPYPQVEGDVYAAVPDGSGGWFIGGDFTRVGGIARNHLAHILSGGSVSAWNPDLDGTVYALALSGSTLYAGGNFTTIKGSSSGPYTRNYLAAISTADANPTTWDPNLDGVVYALALSGSTLYAGGQFSTIGGSACRRLAVFNPPPSVTSITPDHGKNDGTVGITDLAGNGFLFGASVRLRKTGRADIQATNVNVVSANRITCDLDLDGATAGAWDLVVTNPDAQQATLAGGFAVEQVTHTITATAGAGGSIDPSGAVTVNHREDKEFTITPDPSYHVADVLVDGASVGAVASYAFRDVVADHAIDASFAPSSTTWYLAEGCTEGDFETWVLVQNPGDADVTVDLTFMTSQGEQPGPQDYPVPAGTRHSFNLGSYVKDWDVSTRVEATGNVVCERAMYGGNRTWAHDSIGYCP